MKDTYITKSERTFQNLNYSLYSDGTSHPLLFFFHGFTSNRHLGIMGRGEVLARLGFTVVAFDAPYHGDRDNGTFSQLSVSARQKELMEIVIQNAHEAKWLYEKHLQAEQLISKAPVFAFGVSMGAQVCFYLATIMPKLQTIVTLVGSPSFCDFYRWKQQQYQWPDDLEFKIKLEKYQSLDPLIHSERLQNTNIFMGVGTQDDVVPKHYAKQLAEKLKTSVYQEYETAHFSTPKMLDDAYCFLKKTLTF
ncbi:MAG TPA: hypothetical protein PK087_00105 [Bacilli bacterium]|nr:MAG: esterase [Tenericutes bacterium ADurb.BinA124]HNZ49890.1 hypothetical protein [Bacilli bacterium]HOH17700.1 hypothetical protein [Bacilli bacterium]HPX84238.1 hypothetical protein [Bacilli bacterium]HQC74131.1 hypothetical protein [Bacilli bacterium]